MKGREAFKKIREINLQLGGIMPIVDSSIETILIEAGWVSPETIANEYVRLEVEETPDCYCGAKAQTCIPPKHREKRYRPMTKQEVDRYTPMQIKAMLSGILELKFEGQRVRVK